MPPDAIEFVYKIAGRPLYEDSVAAGNFLGAPIDRGDGYVHFSTAAQVRDTLRLHFAGQGDLMLFSVRAADLGVALRWEPSRGGDLFPHLYGALPMSLVVSVAPVAVAADGSTTLPDWVR